MMAAHIEPFYSELGKRVLELRTRRGMTQERLGALLEPPATRASIANIEGGKQRVLVHTLLQLATALQVDADELLDGGPVSETPPQKVAKSVAKELQKKLHLPKEQLERLGRQLGIPESEL
jgi:transcriptional regulator with XRE-family HTH domain